VYGSLVMYQTDSPWLQKKLQERIAFRNEMEALSNGGGGGGGSLDDLKQTIAGDEFFRARLPFMVNDVRNGDFTFLNQNYATSGDRGRVQNIISQYSSLLNSGHTNAEIMSHLYGGDGSDYASWDTDPPDRTSSGEYINPEDDPDGMTPSGPNQHYNGGNNGGNDTNAGGATWNGGGVGQSGSAWGSRLPPQGGPTGQDTMPQQPRGMMAGARMQGGPPQQPQLQGRLSQMQGGPPQVQGRESPQSSSLFSPENEMMRDFISKNLKNRLFGG
jgi:hypothetical protein